MIYKGNQKIEDIYIGNTKIESVYKGSTQVYSSKLPAGQIIFESSTAGTYTIIIPKTQTYHIDLVGGGGGGFRETISSKRTGGSSAYIYGDVVIEKGTYTLVIGSGGRGGSFSGSSATNGTDSSFLGNISGKGYAAENNNGAGGTASVVSSGLIGQNGKSGSTAGWINGYGGGGYGESNGRSGYCKIVTA